MFVNRKWTNESKYNPYGTPPWGGENEWTTAVCGHADKSQNMAPSEDSKWQGDTQVWHLYHDKAPNV